jgi:hypothetical protein
LVVSVVLRPRTKVSCVDKGALGAVLIWTLVARRLVIVGLRLTAALALPKLERPQFPRRGRFCEVVSLPKAAPVGGLFQLPSRRPRFPDDFNALSLMALEGCGYWPQWPNLKVSNFEQTIAEQYGVLAIAGGSRRLRGPVSNATRHYSAWWRCTLQAPQAASSPAYIRILPGVVIRSLPDISTT